MYMHVYINHQDSHSPSWSLHICVSAYNYSKMHVIIYLLSIQDVCPEVNNTEQNPVTCQRDATAMQGDNMRQPNFNSTC